MQQTFETILVTVSGSTAEITINRPDKLNALSAQVFRDLREAVTALRNAPEVRAIVLTGAGEKAFVAGADIGELSQLSSIDAGRAFAEHGQSVLDLIESSPKPFIAAVGGFALGGGCELALACHYRVMADDEK